MRSTRRSSAVPLADRVPGCSVTELEVRHGALNDRSPTALFYFRDPVWVERLPASIDRGRFISPDPEARRRLTLLKESVRAAGYPVRTYP